MDLVEVDRLHLETGEARFVFPAERIRRQALRDFTLLVGRGVRLGSGLLTGVKPKRHISHMGIILGRRVVAFVAATIICGVASLGQTAVRNERAVSSFNGPRGIRW